MLTVQDAPSNFISSSTNTGLVLLNVDIPKDTMTDFEKLASSATIKCNLITMRMALAYYWTYKLLVDSS